MFNNIIMFYFFQKLRKFINRYFLKKNVQILYTSNNIMIINKDFDMKINSNDKEEITVQTALKSLYPSLANEKLFHEYYFPHRLDFATSGLLCIPIHKEACKIVSNTFVKRTAIKYYIAIVRGLLSKEIIDLNTPIGEDIRYKNIQKMCADNIKFCDKPKVARTIFLVLEEGIYDNYPATKVLIRLLTGRRHQIRTHCSFLGHTIVGDFTYSNRKDVKPLRMYLHAIRLILPLSLEYVDVKMSDPFQNADKWSVVKKIHFICNETYEKLNKYS